MPSINSGWLMRAVRVLMQAGILPSEPSLSIHGTKDAGENYFQIIDAQQEVLFGIDYDGNFIGKHLSDLAYLKDTHASSGVYSPGSVYIGSSRISNIGGVLRFYTLKATVPVAMQAAPFSLSAVPAGVTTIHDWRRHARYPGISR